MTGNRHAPRFCRMLILPVATFCDDQVPIVSFDELDNITNFHVKILAYNVVFDDVYAYEGGEVAFL